MLRYRLGTVNDFHWGFIQVLFNVSKYNYMANVSSFLIHVFYIIVHYWLFLSLV